jgi:alpha-ribazole phosphatase
MGEWEGQTFAALHDEAPGVVAQVFNDPARFVYPHGESFGAFTARVRGALDKLLKTHESGNIALITHGAVCRLIIVIRWECWRKIGCGLPRITAA